MIYYFIKKSGGGKSSLATAFSVPFLENDSIPHRDSNHLLEFLELSPKDRLQECYKRITYYNSIGYQFKEKPEHCLHSSFGIYTEHFGEKIVNYDLPGSKLGLYDKRYKTLIPPPCPLIIWDETQNEADGRDSMEMPKRLISFLNLHRKWGIDLLCFSQRDKVDKYIRENCVIILIDSMTHKKDKYGFILSTTWKLKVFDDYLAYEMYKGTLNSKYYKSTSYTFEGCVFDHFNSREGEEYFLECAVKNGGFSLAKAIVERTSRQKIEQFLKNHPYTSPKGFKKGSEK